MNRRVFIQRTSLAASGMLWAASLRGVSSGPGGATEAAGSNLLAGLKDGDLRLPPWGPYTKAYAGISHLPALDSGIRFDLSVFPGLYRRRQPVPTVTSDSGFVAWSAEPNFREYTLRHVLEGLESLFADITYREHVGGRLVHTRFVNRTALPQQVCLHYLASINFPEAGPYRQPPLRPAEVTLPEGSIWIDGSHYAKLRLDENAPQRHLPDNAEIWGEVRGDGFVNGTALGRGFGRDAGDEVTYAVPADFTAAGAVAILRYRLPANTRCRIRCEGRFAGQLELAGNGGLQTVVVPAGDEHARSFRVIPVGGQEIEIDGFALVPRAAVEEVKFVVKELEYQPRIERAGDRQALTLKYAAIEGHYGFAWSGESEVREWLTDRLERDFPLYAHEHVKRRLDLGGAQHFTNVFVRPVFLAPGETKDLYAFVAHAATASEVMTQLTSFKPPTEPVANVVHLPAHTPAGEDYAYGIERLAATVATNVVYPVRRKGRFIRHYTPGRWWDSLYTWDAGFIGLGLLELEPARSVDNLAAYLTASSDDMAFVHHGSPVPVQIYQLQALWNRTQDRELLRRFFPGARRMHRYLAGRSDGSRTRTLASGLIRTWDYFYNSGGWDDYPPQKFIRGTKLTATVTPVVNSAHAIRTARILRSLALVLDEPVGEFDTDITSLATVLQQEAWNPESGWFSYVRHDEEGRAVGPLLHESGEDFNQGLDGIYPLVAGICTPGQERLFLERLRDPAVFWTSSGLTTVSRSAAYFRADGYWNGTVWMAHQWFFWKTLLDLGAGELAWQIAQTALSVWEREVRSTGCSFEHFIVATGRGAGWHQFGGLSSPLLGWFAAYFRPGTLTTGFDGCVLAQEFAGGRLRARVRLAGSPRRLPVVLAVVPGANRATWNGEPLAVRSRVAGMVEAQLPTGAGEGELVVG